MRIADLIFEMVSKEVDTVFYLPGGGCGPLVDALGQSGLKAVSCLHEQGAGFAALGYAQYKGLGVCLVTSGPGVTNALTPCLAAWLDSIPVMFISGNVPSKQFAKDGMRSLGTQEAPTIALVKPITKDAQLIRGVKGARYYTDLLITTALAGRQGPVWMDIPMEVQGMNV